MMVQVGGGPGPEYRNLVQHLVKQVMTCRRYHVRHHRKNKGALLQYQVSRSTCKERYQRQGVLDPTTTHPSMCLVPSIYLHSKI